MSSQPTARDAVIGTLVAANEHPWVQPPPNMVADAVLATLGIPADTPTDDVKAGLIALRIAAEGPSICIHANGTLPGRDDAYVAGTSCDRDAYGPTPAAAVLALAARMEEPHA